MISEEKRAAFEAHYKKGATTCDLCNSSEHVIPVARGKPSQELMEFAKEGNVKLGGCTFSAAGYCTKCSHYIEKRE